MVKNVEELAPKQLAFLRAYLEIDSETFGNAYQSALKAGYREEYAKSITGKELKWLAENGSDIKMLQKAERNLDKAMDIDVADKEIGERSLKASMFVAKGLGKAKYSERQELTGSGGKDLISVEAVKERLNNLKK